MLRRCLPIFIFVLAIFSVAPAQTPLRLQPVTPCRLVDTRPAGPIQAGTFQTFNLRSLAQSGGVGCHPFSLSTAQAYSLNVTLVPVNGGPVAYLTIWPTGEPQPNVSLMNSDGRVKANAAVVPAGSNGEVNVYVTNTTNVLIDIDAYFDTASDTTALAFFPLPPCRIVDTRNNQDGGRCKPDRSATSRYRQIATSLPLRRPIPSTSLFSQLRGSWITLPCGPRARRSPLFPPSMTAPGPS